MREILFRGKRVDNGEWVEGSVVHQTLHYGDPVDRYHIIYDGEFDYDYYSSARVIPKTVGQYTGLTDKNGTKIFDGDVVRLFLKGGSEVGPIMLSNIDARYKFASPDGTAYGIGVTDTFEVIGTIHDNPELLKGESDNA